MSFPDRKNIILEERGGHHVIFVLKITKRRMSKYSPPIASGALFLERFSYFHFRVKLFAWKKFCKIILL